MKGTDMHYSLTGFTHSTGFRVFSFEGITAHSVRTTYSVRADLTLARKHGIRVQELALLCHGILERRREEDDQRAFTFTEDDMSVHASLVSASLEAKKRKAPRRHFAAGAVAPA